MHDPSFLALALIVSEKLPKRKNSTKVYAADNNDDAGKTIHMSRFCFAGETKRISADAISRQKVLWFLVLE